MLSLIFLKNKYEMSIPKIQLPQPNKNMRIAYAH